MVWNGSSCIRPGMDWALEIHEPPRIGRKDKTRLEAGMADPQIEHWGLRRGLGWDPYRSYGAGDGRRVRDPYAYYERTARDLIFRVCAKLFLRWWAITRLHGGP